MDKKSIIVIKTPISCVTCPLSICDGYTKSYYCGGTWEYSREIEDFKWQREKPEWCPLSPLPEEKDIDWTASEYEDGRVIGWNECLDEIMQKEEQK